MTWDELSTVAGVIAIVVSVSAWVDIKRNWLKWAAWHRTQAELMLLMGNAELAAKYELAARDCVRNARPFRS
jgi:hypothetical protein